MKSAKVIFTSALIYLVAVSFFAWGIAVGKYKVFPWQQLAAVYEELHAYLTFKDGSSKSIKDKIALDHQELRRRYEFSGLRVRDASFHDPGYLLISRYSKKHQQVIIELLSIDKNQVVHTWIPPLTEIFEKSTNLGSYTRTPETFRGQHPLLLENGDVIFTSGDGPMVRIDACSNIVWLISRRFHHSIEVDSAGDIVACIEVEGEGPSTPFPIRDDGVAVVSMEGEILKEYSMTDILLKNGYQWLVYGIGPFEEDRMHLNDAQPIRQRGSEAQVGDIAVSIRHLSTVALFNPADGKLKWLKAGPWLNQHDINQLEDGRYSIFGNDVVRREGEKPKLLEDQRSAIYFYDARADLVSQPYAEIMAREKIATSTSGRLRILANGDAFIEESNKARLIRISQEKVRWEYVNALSPDTIGAVHWSRYIPAHELKLTWKENVTCR